MKKISNKIISAIMISVIIATLGVGYTSAISARKAISEQAYNNMQSLSARYAYQMETSFAHYEGVAQTMGIYLSATFTYSKARNISMSEGYFKELDIYLQEISKQNPDLLSVYAFINPEFTKTFFGTWFTEESKVEFDPYDAYKEYINGDKKWKWHREILEDREALWSDPYFNEQFNRETISYLYPITGIVDPEAEEIEEVVIAFVGVDIPFDEFRDIASANSNDEIGGTILLDSSDRIIVDTNYSEGTSLEEAGYEEIGKSIHKQERGFITMKIGKLGSCFVGFEKLDNGFTFAVYSQKSEVLKSVRSTTFTITMVSIVFIGLAGSLAFVVGNSISKPIYLVIEDLLLMETGDFTGSKHKECLRNKDETGKLASALDVIQISMGEMVGVVNENGIIVAELVKKMEDIVERLMDRAYNVAGIAQELSATMEETTATAESLSNSSEYVKERIEAMGKKNVAGTSVVNIIADKAESINKEFSSDAKKAEELTKSVVVELKSSIEDSKKVEQIKQLTNIILKVASETSLLSLNASIEAARFGEQGKGFGVVANEISRLAEESQSTGKRIQKNILDVVESVEKLGKNAEMAIDFINDFIINGYGKLFEITDQYKVDSSDIKEVFAGFGIISNDILNETKILNDAFHELKHSTFEGSRGIQELSLNADEMSDITGFVQKQSKELTEVFNKLRNAIDKFTV